MFNRYGKALPRPIILKLGKSLCASAITSGIFEHVAISTKMNEPLSCTDNDWIIIRLHSLHFCDLDNPLNRPLMICDRCRNVEEIVVALMQIDAVEDTLALCGSCLGELPTGLKVA